MSSVKITPMATDGIEYSFTIHSEADNLAKGYEFDIKTAAYRARNKAIKTFKSNGYTVIQ